MPYQIFCLGDPLVDMQVRDGEALLEKYGLEPNNAIRAGEQHQPIYDEIASDYAVTYVAGGGAQNAARGAAYVLPPGSVVYTGCVGDDELTERLRTANAREGVDEVYLVKEGDKTGACAVIITGHHRSLVTTLRAAGKFEASHLSSPRVAPLVQDAQLFYVEGFFLTHGVQSALALAEHASANDKTFALNLSAPYIPSVYAAHLARVLPYTDLVIGNDAEARECAKAVLESDDADLESDDADLVAIAERIAGYPKANARRPRVVVITRGADSTVVVDGARPGVHHVFPVTPVASDRIVDTNGAGDAFAGGFLGAYVSGKSLAESVEVGHKLGAMCVQLVGPQYQWPKEVL